MRLDETLGDGEPEPGTSLTFVPPRLPKPVEQPGEVLCGDAAAGVPHPEQDLALSRRAPDPDAPFRRGELDGVPDEVLEKLQQPVPIGPHLGEVSRKVEVERQASRPGDRDLHRDRIGDHATGGDAARRHDEPAIFEPGHVEQVLDETGHPHHRTLDGRSRSGTAEASAQGFWLPNEAVPERIRLHCRSDGQPLRESVVSGTRVHWR